MWLRCLTWWRAAELDSRLAGGADPMESDDLSLRVGQLGSARTRARLACALRGAVELASRPPDPLRTAPPLIRRDEIRDNRELLLELAERVHASGPLGVKGVAKASLLVIDGGSPLYDAEASRSLAAAAYEALVALDRGHRTANTSDR